LKTATVTYTGNLRTLATHFRSGVKIYTDAPPDNNGKGEAFSPSDLLATSLVSCMITIIGIVAEKRKLRLGEVNGTVEKGMADSPRRVASLNVKITFTDHKLAIEDQAMLEKMAVECPVALSIHPDIKTSYTFVF
jgi:putative redox protein